MLLRRRYLYTNTPLPQVATEVKWARSSGALPPPDPNDLEPPAQDPDADDLLEPEGWCRPIVEVQSTRELSQLL